MNGTLSAYDYYGLATEYRKRCFVAVNGDDTESRVQAGRLSIDAYQKCIQLQIKDPLFGTQDWTQVEPDASILSANYYLGLMYSNSTSHDFERDMWDRLILVHMCARSFINFIWTANMYRVPGLEPHITFLSHILPDGYFGRFNLEVISQPLQASQPPSLQESISFVNSDIMTKRKTASSTTTTVVEDESLIPQWTARKFQILANKALKGIIECAEEIAMYISTAAAFTPTVDTSQGYMQLLEVPCPPMMNLYSSPISLYNPQNAQHSQKNTLEGYEFKNPRYR